MLRLDNSQLDQLGKAKFQRYVTETALHLRNRFPDETLTIVDDDLEALVIEACERGRSYDVRSAYDMRRFAECLVTHGRAFPDDAGWAKKILTREDLTPSAKMTAISNYEVFVLRHEA